jgi:hypothetical protein
VKWVRSLKALVAEARVLQKMVKNRMAGGIHHQKVMRALSNTLVGRITAFYGYLDLEGKTPGHSLTFIIAPKVHKGITRFAIIS